MVDNRVVIDFIIQDRYYSLLYSICLTHFT